MKIAQQKGHEITKPELLELGRLLLKAGYTVRLGRDKNGNTWQHYIEAIPKGEKVE